jgi:hypothetical protein
MKIGFFLKATHIDRNFFLSQQLLKYYSAMIPGPNVLIK